MYTQKEILDYRCPRWDDWPNIELYMDQVVSLIEENVAPFYPPDQAKTVTSTMINNYVKQKIAPPSHKKKYRRNHIAVFYIIFLLKSAMGLSDVCASVALLQGDAPLQETYNRFCRIIEEALAAAFGGPCRDNNGTLADDPMRTVALAFSYIHLARFQVQAFKDGMPVSEINPPIK